MEVNFLQKKCALCYTAGIVAGRSGIGGPSTHPCTESGAESTGNHLNKIPVKFGLLTPSIREVVDHNLTSENAVFPQPSLFACWRLRALKEANRGKKKRVHRRTSPVLVTENCRIALKEVNTGPKCE